MSVTHREPGSLELLRYLSQAPPFSFLFPPGWERVAETEQLGAVVLMGEPGAEAFRPNIVVTLDRQASQGLQARAAAGEEFLADHQHLFRCLDRSEVEGAPTPILLGLYTSTNDDAVCLTQLIAWSEFQDGTGFMLTATCAAADYPRWASTFQTCLTNVRLDAVEES